MFYWSFTSLVHFWSPPIFNPGYARVASVRVLVSWGSVRFSAQPRFWFDQFKLCSVSFPSLLHGEGNSYDTKVNETNEISLLPVRQRECS